MERLANRNRFKWNATGFPCDSYSFYAFHNITFQVIYVCQEKTRASRSRICGQRFTNNPSKNRERQYSQGEDCVLRGQKMAWCSTLQNSKLYIFHENAHFSTQKSNYQLLHFKQYTSEPRMVQPITKNASMRWLGVYFDPRLPFNDLAAKLGSKGRRAAEGLIVLANIVQGMDAKIMQQAVHAFILPILTYSPPAWWPGQKRINSKGKTIQNGFNRHLKKLDKAQNLAPCAVLPAWKTTPTKFLQKEAATPPIEQNFNYLFKLASIRLHRLELRHPLRLRTKKANTTLSLTRLERIAWSCLFITQYSNPLLELEPWEEHLFEGAENVFQAKGSTEDKKKASSNFKFWAQNLNLNDMLIYIDRSQEIDKGGTPTGTRATWVIK